MNERIKELAKQAGGHKCLCVDAMSISLLGENSIEKFAELLLNEFIDALEYSNCIRGETSDYGLSILINDIKERFDEPTRN